jgi:hypothetical protein
MLVGDTGGMGDSEVGRKEETPAFRTAWAKCPSYERKGGLRSHPTIKRVGNKLPTLHEFLEAAFVFFRAARRGNSHSTCVFSRP